MEQVATGIKTRNTLGLKTSWPSSGIYKQFAQLPLLQSTQAALASYTRFCLNLQLATRNQPMAPGISPTTR